MKTISVSVLKKFWPIVGNPDRDRFFLAQEIMLGRRLDRLATSPAFFQMATGALVASGIWAVAVLVWGL